jgi:aldose 1-epimerase
MSLIKLGNEFGSAGVTPSAGAALRSFRPLIAGTAHELLTGGLEEPLDESALRQGNGSFIMAPWVNRIHRGLLVTEHGEFQLPVDSGEHSIHGTVRGRSWDVVSESDTAVTMQITLEEPWPFKGHVVSRVSLEGASLRQTLEVHAADGERRFPAGVGWHPWFRRSLGTEELGVQADVVAQWELDAGVVPSGKAEETEATRKLKGGSRFSVGEVDGCFQFGDERTAEIRWPELTLRMSSSPEISQVMVYSPEHSVCVEPQTSAVNAFQLEVRGIQGTGTLFASPDNPLVASTIWVWSKN